MKQRSGTFLTFLLVALSVGLVSYVILSWAGLFDHQSISHSKLLTPPKGTYECDIIEVGNLHYIKNDIRTIRSVSVTCHDRKIQKIKKYTFTRYDNLPKYIKGLDNHEGWYVNSIDVFTDSSLETGEGHVIIFTTKKPLKTHVSIFLPETYNSPESNM